MQRSLLARARQVVVGVGLNEQTPELVATAAELCRRTSRELILVHVLEPWITWPHPVAEAPHDPLWDVNRAIETSARQMALGALHELKATYAADLKVQELVVTGKPAEVLAHEAQRMGACLLIVGATGGGQGAFWPTGTATALSLFATSPVPVLALTPKARVSCERLRLLLCDDLSEETAAAADYAFELAALLGDATVDHLCVNGLTAEALEAALNMAKTTSHTPVDTSAAILHQRLVGDLATKLRARAASHLEDLRDADCTYNPEVVTGRIEEELSRAVERTRPDMLVFGRHKAIHHHPFFLGRLPFKTMLAPQRSVLVVPNG